VSIDDVYTYNRGHGQSVAAQLASAQFPTMPTFLKLTLLNICLQHAVESRNPMGYPVFKITA
jgi:hypothetical protein